ncbi:MAG: hypothetical protein Q9222_001547 [Ikaeria aurantiellina]
MLPSNHLQLYYHKTATIPIQLFEAIESHIPPLELDLEISGTVPELKQVLTKISCLRLCRMPPGRIRDRRNTNNQDIFPLELLTRQTRLCHLEIYNDSAWRFETLDNGTAVKTAPLTSLGLAGIVLHDDRLVNNGLIDPKALKALSLLEVRLITPVFGEWYKNMPDLREIRLDAPHGSFESTDAFLDEGQLSKLLDFFSAVRLAKIAIRNYAQNLPWTDLASMSGSTLQHLNIHTGVTQWRCIDRAMVPTAVDPIKAQYLQVRQATTFTYDQFVALNESCPNIQRLGFDITDLSMAAAGSHLLRALRGFRSLQHLKLFFSPTILPGRADYNRPESWDNDKYSHILVPGAAFVELFNSIARNKEGVRLQTLLYADETKKRCMMWSMGPDRILLCYQAVESKGTSVETREMYVGTKLLWTREKIVRFGYSFDAFEFPG